MTGMKKQDPKVVENRLRDTLKRRGYTLVKSRRRDPLALTYGRYWVIFERSAETPFGFAIPATEGDPERDYTMTLAEVDAWCASGKPLAREAIPKMACLLAFEAYFSERREATPEQESTKPAPTAKGRR